MTCFTMENDGDSGCQLRHADGATAVGVRAIDLESTKYLCINSGITEAQQQLSELQHNEEKSIINFGRHCFSYYKSSLVLPYPSHGQPADSEEKKDDDDELFVQHGKVAVEALDRISSIRAIIDARQQIEGDKKHSEILLLSIEKLRDEHASAAEKHGNFLSECGLKNVDRFIDEVSCNNRDGTVLLQKYAQMRDAMRRKSHKLAMMQRQSSLFELLSHSEQERSTLFSNAAQATDADKKHLTRMQNIQNTIFAFQSFVKKYQSNIGSHSFLAGLHKMITLQLNPTNSKNKIARWKFRGTVLTEACRSGSCSKEDSLAYARDATAVLFSILVWIRDVDVEGGSRSHSGSSETEDEIDWDEIMNSTSEVHLSDEMDATLSFEVDKYLSDANLRRILAVLPNPKALDARATGTVDILTPSTAGGSEEFRKEGVDVVRPRMNADGNLDEAWPWFASWQFCTVL